jgi:hypothetical protein
MDVTGGVSLWMPPPSWSAMAMGAGPGVPAYAVRNRAARSAGGVAGPRKRMPPAPAEAATCAAAMSKFSTGATSNNDARLCGDHPSNTDSFEQGARVVDVMVVGKAAVGGGVLDVATDTSGRFGPLEQPATTTEAVTAAASTGRQR